MTLEEFKNILSSTGLPVAYLAFPETQAPQMPFIVYQETGSHNAGADNKVWFSATRIQVDLLTRRRSRTTEVILEQALEDTEIYWERVPDYDEDQDYYRVTYEMEI